MLVRDPDHRMPSSFLTRRRLGSYICCETKDKKNLCMCWVKVGPLNPHIRHNDMGFLQIDMQLSFQSYVLPAYFMFGIAVPHTVLGCILPSFIETREPNSRGCPTLFYETLV